MSELNAREFERFFAALMQAVQLQIITPPRPGKDLGYDFTVQSKSGERAIVEVRLYPTLLVAHNLFRLSFNRLRAQMNIANVGKALFATNARVPESIRQEAMQLSIVIYDYDVISSFVADLPQFYDDWNRLSQEGFIYRSEPLPPATPIRRPEFGSPEEIATGSAASSTLPPTPRLPPSLPVNRGREICQALRALKPGKGKFAAEFERLCIDALKYLFEDDFINWTPQKKSHTRLHRYDLIARISSKSDFWTAMLTDHRARYVIFEFKNYREKITQSEIYTTEKYLLPLAMRSMAIIISRAGVSDSAYRVMAGALREDGKLILGLNLDQFCTMLHRRDNGEDPITVLSDELDALLVGMER